MPILRQHVTHRFLSTLMWLATPTVLKGQQLAATLGKVLKTHLLKMVHRQEWQSQQPIRSASLRAIARIDNTKHHKRGTLWLTSPPPAAICYLLSQLQDGRLALLDPNSAAAQPICLGVYPPLGFHAYIGETEHLHIVELGYAAHAGLDWAHSDYSITWHIVNPATRQILRSQRKHGWPTQLPKLKHVYHAASSRVVAMSETNTLAIMHAVTLEEITRCDISPRHPSLIKANSGVMEQLAWSHSGSMLAVAMSSYPAMLDGEDGGWDAAMRAGKCMASEVYIFDTATGCCLQSVAMPASRVSLSWSPCADQLAVESSRQCWQEFLDRYQPQGDQASVDDGPSDHAGRPCNFLWGAPEDDDSYRFEGQVWLLTPQFGRSELLGSPQGLQSQAQWTHCQWSPHGRLLVLRWASNCSSFASGFKVLDSKTLQAVFESLNPAGNMSWAASAPSALRGPCLSAVFPKEIVCFTSTKEGEWEVRAQSSSLFEPVHTVHISPDGDTIIGLRQKSSGQYGIYHRSLGQDMGEWLGTEDRQYPPDWHPEWVPFSCRWSQIYASIHPAQLMLLGTENMQGPAFGTPSISLVDAKRNAVLGTWTPNALANALSQTMGDSRRCERSVGAMYDTLWSPDGRHLAVFCDSCILVMDFSMPCAALGPLQTDLL